LAPSGAAIAVHTALYAAAARLRKRAEVRMIANNYGVSERDLLIAKVPITQ